MLIDDSRRSRTEHAKTYLYHASAPSGRLFEGKEDIAKAKDDGWVDAPWLVGQQLVVQQEPKRGPGRPPGRKDD